MVPPGARAPSAARFAAPILLAALAPWAPTGHGAAGQAAVAPVAGRAVAFTFDDLPATRHGSLADVRGITGGLLATLRVLAIPATGFVNESKLELRGEDAARAKLLEAWLDAGHDLGNHTYSHRRLYDTPLPEFREEVLKGERVTRRLLAARGRAPRYFRHPTLNTGPDLATKEAFETFLTENGYTVAPVTIDNDEFLYAAAYDRARARRDRAALGRLGRDYLRYMGETVDFYERLSHRLFGREIPQILLLHANALNAEYLDELAAMLKTRGYRFIALDRALADAAYRSPDTYIGDRGPSWLQRWAITRGEAPGAEPTAPEWVQTAAIEP